MFANVRLHAGIAFALVAATLAIYLQVREHAFVNFDDYVYLANIRTGLSAEGIHRAFTSSIVSNWVPLTWIALLVDYELYGTSPAGYHLTSVALHALNAVLLYLALFRMTGAVWRSACVAALFAVHPLHVESVAWLSERKDVLSGTFWLLTLHAYARWVASSPSSARYLLVLVCLALGLLAKPMVVTLPFVLLLLDYWPLDRLRAAGGGALPDARSMRSAVVEKLPMFALVAAASVVAVATQRAAGSLPDADLIALPARVSNALESYVVYVWKSLWPTGLAVFYPHPRGPAAPARIIAYALLLAAVTAWVLRSAGRHPYAAVGWLWYLGALVPVIGMVQVGAQARADRYMYLPQIGLCIALVWGAADLVGRRRSLRLAVAAAFCAALVASGIGSWRQVSTWRDTLSLWERAAAVAGESFRTHHGLAGALRRRGRLEEAEAQYTRALRLRPDSARANIGMAETLAGRRRYHDAIAYYEIGLAIAPDNRRTQINFGHTLLNAGRVREARAQLERVWEAQSSGQASLTRPFRFSLHTGLAAALEREGELDGAIRHLQRALEVRPNAVDANLRLGVLAGLKGRNELALLHLERARDRGGASPELDAAIAEIRGR
jgi:tetratricopeptide (TPR) repeat protein